MTENGKLRTVGLLTLSVLFWAVLSDAWGYSEHFLTELPNAWNRYIYGYVSRLVWAMPFLILIMQGKHGEAVSPKQLLGLCLHWKSFLLALAACTVYILCGMLFTHGGWWTNPDILFSQELFKLLIVGFVEELVYRGFGITALSRYMSGRRANILSGIFFAALHFPAYFIHWYRDGIFSFTAMLTQGIGAFLLGLLFGVVFRKSKSVWASAIVHFWYDFAFVAFIG